MDEIQQCVDEFLTGKIFNENEADQLINDILEKVMEILYRLKKPLLIRGMSPKESNWKQWVSHLQALFIIMM